MAEEGKGVALAILGVVAVIAVVGLVLLFTGATGKFAGGGSGFPKLYTRESVIGHGSGAANVENPYYGYEYETFGGVAQSRTATGKRIASGGAWDPNRVYGETPFDASTEPGVYAGPSIPGSFSPTTDTNPRSIPSAQSDVCGGCPYGSNCIADPRRVPSGAESVSGYPGCYVLGSR